MTEWAVVGIVVAIAGCGWSIIKGVSSIIQPLTEQITRLNESMKNINDDLAELSTRNTKTHDRLFNALGEHGDKLSDHEIRIVKLEEHEKK